MKHIVRIDGSVFTNLTADEWTDEFIKWLESRAERTVLFSVGEEEEKNEDNE